MVTDKQPCVEHKNTSVHITCKDIQLFRCSARCFTSANIIITNSKHRHFASDILCVLGKCECLVLCLCLCNFIFTSYWLLMNWGISSFTLISTIKDLKHTQHLLINSKHNAKNFINHNGKNLWIQITIIVYEI